MKVRQNQNGLLTMHPSWNSLQNTGAARGKQWEGRRDIMSRDFGLISLRLADLGREDSSAGETE